MLEAAIITVNCSVHGLERIRVRMVYHKSVVNPQPKYVRSIFDKKEHLKFLVISERISREKIAQVIKEHYPQASDVRFVEA